MIYYSVDCSYYHQPSFTALCNKKWQVLFIPVIFYYIIDIEDLTEKEFDFKLIFRAINCNYLLSLFKFPPPLVISSRRKTSSGSGVVKLVGPNITAIPRKRTIFKL
ncbi:hypothetical protein [Neobacillus endophyticus]|uniref:hypothetical protein n=1 Tax=Neobacillus endophyticus TaxID=2738405 RepID=UPI001C2704FE|nr:hypothetical protein [Neobacillus endophyticus]